VFPGTFGWEDWEKQAIIAFHLKNPLEGYRRGLMRLYAGRRLRLVRTARRAMAGSRIAAARSIRLRERTEMPAKDSSRRCSIVGQVLVFSLFLIQNSQMIVNLPGQSGLPSIHRAESPRRSRNPQWRTRTSLL
jgi:hypothetical protein